MQQFKGILVSLAVCLLIVAQTEVSCQVREIIEDCAGMDIDSCGKCCKDNAYTSGYLFDKTNKLIEITESCICQDVNGKNVLSSQCYIKSADDCETCCASSSRFTSGQMIENFAGLDSLESNGGMACVCRN